MKMELFPTGMGNEKPTQACCPSSKFSKRSRLSPNFRIVISRLLRSYIYQDFIPNYCRKIKITVFLLG